VVRCGWSSSTLYCTFEACAGWLLPFSPPADCQHAVLSLSDRLGVAQDIFCRCGCAFCFNCREEAHRPVDCETVRKWMVSALGGWGGCAGWVDGRLGCGDQVSIATG
jgi:hypothetical protein